MRLTAPLAARPPALVCLVLLVVLPLTACNSLPSSAYARAQGLAPVLATALLALAPEQGPRVDAAVNAVNDLFKAYSHADAKRFDALLPCVIAALKNAADVVGPDKAKALLGVAGILSALAPAAVCSPPSSDDEDAGSASRALPGGASVTRAIYWQRNYIGEPIHVRQLLAVA